MWRNGTTGENYLYPMDGLAIKPSEGYIRTIADQNWHVVYRSPWPEEMSEASTEVQPATLPEAELMLTDAALSNVATFHGLEGTIELGSFDGRPLPQGADPAKRLSMLLQGVVGEYEKRFGTLNIEAGAGQAKN